MLAKRFAIIKAMQNEVYKAVNLTTGEVIAARVKIACDFRSRSVGLLNRSSLQDDEALLIKPCNSIHTFFMKFPIDVVFLDQKGKVVRAKKNLVPWRLCFCLIKGYMTLELPAGKLDKSHINVGEILKIAN